MSTQQENVSEDFSFECKRCNCSAYSLKADGAVKCMNCGLMYFYLNAMKQWVLRKMDVEEYLTKYLGKQWDEKEMRYLDKKEIDERRAKREEERRIARELLIKKQQQEEPPKQVKGIRKKKG